MNHIEIASGIFKPIPESIRPHGLGRHTGDILTVLTGLFAAWWFYDRHRKTIFVRDLVYGRHFRANSVEQLIMYEEMLAKGAAYLRRLMEAAKNWDSSEVREVPAFDDDMEPKIIIKDFM